MGAWLFSCMVGVMVCYGYGCQQVGGVKCGIETGVAPGAQSGGFEIRPRVRTSRFEPCREIRVTMELKNRSCKNRRASCCKVSE